MPERHEYQCLNPNCESKELHWPKKSAFFTAMNDEAVCPHCDSIKLRDCGLAGRPIEAPSVISGEARNNIKNSDANLRRIAERYDMTNMSNKDGRGVKANQAAQQTGPSVNVGGVPVPVSAAASGACINMPNMAKTLTGSWSGAKEGGMLKGMTNVVGRHDG